jgi:P27 family predicted phage terminase small subunit
MSKRGTKKHPTTLKVIKGTLRKSRQNIQEPKPDLRNKIPLPPQRFSVRAKNIWRKVCKDLLQINLLTDTDIHLIEEYVYWKEQSEIAEKELKENGYVMTFTNKANQEYLTESPWLNIKKNASDRVLKIGVQFGFTPSSRSDIKAPPMKDEDPLAELLRKKQEKKA